MGDGVRSLVKALIPPNGRYALRLQWTRLREGGPVTWVRWNALLADAWIRDRLNRSHYTLLDEAQLRATRTSDTVFVFGSGYSLNELSPADWGHFIQHDTVGFNAFYFERWIPVGFHLLRGGI